MVKSKQLTQTESISFDSIRGTSALIVAIAHTIQIFVMNHTKSYQLVHGITGLFSQGAVAVFFAMSGFMIAKSISNNVDRYTKFEPIPYFKSRALRIYPPLIFALLLSFVLCKITPALSMSGEASITLDHGYIGTDVMKFNYREWFASMFFMNGFLTEYSPGQNGVLWTLSMEVWCYILAGLFFIKRRFYTIAAIIIIYFLYRLDSQLGNRFLLVGLVWASGFLVSYLHNIGLERINRFLPAVVLFSVLTVTLFFGSAWIESMYLKPADYYRAGIGVFFSFVVYFLLRHKKMAVNFLPNSAKYSYTLYIIHFPILAFLYVTTERFNTGLVASLSIGVVALFISIFVARYAANYVENKQWIKKILG